MGTSMRDIEIVVTKKVDSYVKVLLKSADACKEEGVIHSLMSYLASHILSYIAAMEIIKVLHYWSMLC